MRAKLTMTESTHAVSMKQRIEDIHDLHALLESIEMRDTRLADWNFDWKIGEISSTMGWHIQCSFERPDADTGETGTGYGRKWIIEPGASITSVVFTAWKAIELVIFHELHESFTVVINGERVRLLDPHKSLTDLAVGSRRV